MNIDVDDQDFRRFLEAAELYWKRGRSGSSAERWIVVEAFHPDIRVHVRNLTLAGVLSRITGARLVVLTGADPEWEAKFWLRFDTGRVKALAEAYGADEVLDVHALAAQQVRDGALPDADLDPRALAVRTDSTLCRLLCAPRVPAGYDRAPRAELGRALAAVYAMIFHRYAPEALITCDVEYDQWGLAVELAVRWDVPILHVQTTGSLKAYGLFPGTRAGEPTFRGELTLQIGDFFRANVWENRALLEPGVARVTERARLNMGRPSWWRKDGQAALELRTETERERFRSFAQDRFGFDHDRPVVAVFAHALSDALGTNREVFADLAEWLEETARFAYGRSDANWLFLDHPHQRIFDETGFFEELAVQYAGAPNMRFLPSVDVSKNSLYALTDLGVTVRGSVANELPALGIPVLQAGWSEWSGCGFSRVAADRSAYWKALDDSIGAVAAGRSLLDDDQVAGARLWQWFYRCGTDVPSQLVPHWETMPARTLLRHLETRMLQIEDDGEPLFAAVARMWERREPVLTRFDLTDAAEIRRHVR